MISNINISDLILTITLIAIAWTAIETRRIANEAVEANLKPLIFRAGQIIDWKVLSVEDMTATNSQPTLEFTNIKNVATDITGYIVLGHKKYTLIFNGDVRGAKIIDTTTTKVVYNAKWGWLPSGGKLLASYKASEFAVTDGKNQIYLSYRDTQGNSYNSIENENYSQTSERVGDQSILLKVIFVGFVLLGVVGLSVFAK